MVVYKMQRSEIYTFTILFVNTPMKITPSNEWKTVKIDPKLHADLKAIGAKNGLSMIEFLELICLDWLAKQSYPTPPAQRPKSTQRDLILVSTPERTTKP